MILNDSGGSKKSKYPTPSKGIVGINKPKTPVKQTGSSAWSSFVKLLNTKQHFVTPAKKAPAKKTTSKPSVVHKPVTMPKTSKPSTSSAYSRYKAITSAPKKPVVVAKKPVVVTKKPVTTTVKKTTPVVNHTTAPVSKAQAYHAAVKSTPTNPIVHSVAPSKTPVPTKAPTKPVVPVTHHTPTPQETALRNAQMAWYNNYNKQIANGTNNLADMDRYNGYVKNLHLNKGTVSESTLHQLSLKALSGDKTAQNYLKQMGVQAQTGSKLWAGYDTNKLTEGSALYHQYIKDNPLSNIAKTSDTKMYNAFNDKILNNKPMTEQEMAWYRQNASKWNVDDLTDPYQMQMHKLNDDKKNALNAQDVALNQGMATMDANNFQQFQQLQQQMSNRGVADSGIAADTYMRAQMGNNANYQQAFADAATKKSETAAQYDTDIYGVKQDQIKNQMDRDAADAKAQADAMSAQAELAKQQTAQDQYLTSSTGYVYVGGKQLTMNGKPITSMEYNKLSETQRHNLATETNTATKNAQDYTLGQDKNDISRTKIASDLQIALAKNQLDQNKLTFSYAKLDSDNSYHQALIQKAANAAQNATDKTQLTALGKQSDTLAKQISAIQKKKKQTSADKASLKKLIGQYNSVNNNISKIIGGNSFKGTSGGGGSVNINSAPSGSPAAFGGFRRVSQAPSAFNGQMNQAINKGVPFAQAKLLTELIGRESGFRSSAKNPTSSAYGYGQFLTSTRNAYAKKYPNLNYNNPVDQIVLTWKYVQERYGTAQHALEMWEKRSPHWY